MTSPTLARHGRVGTRRPDPRAVRWTAADLARRRALVTARNELEAALERGDPAPVTGAWRALVGVLARAELDRLAERE